MQGSSTGNKLCKMLNKSKLTIDRYLQQNKIKSFKLNKR